MKPFESWKKVFENDLEGLVTELENLLEVPSVLILTGDLGVGKTTFTNRFSRHINKLLETDSPDVLSPTYSLINENGELIHADFYRLKSSDEIMHLELSLYLDDRSYFFVEWGKAHEKELKRELGNDFHFYELVIDTNTADSKGNISRNYLLYDINTL